MPANPPISPLAADFMLQVRNGIYIVIFQYLIYKSGLFAARPERRTSTCRKRTVPVVVN
jgi:hypothetical protein